MEEQLIFLLKDIFSTGFTGIVPVSISSLGNGVLGSFDNLSLASYFGFLAVKSPFAFLYILLEGTIMKDSLRKDTKFEGLSSIVVEALSPT